MSDLEQSPVQPARHHPNLDHKITPWLDEAIWGHRLWDSQSAWLVFLEFLTVAEACHADGNLLQPGAPYPLTFRPAQRLYLRNILFNSEDAMRVAAEHGDERASWEAWTRRMEEQARGVPTRDFSYLRPRFHSFREFAEIVRLLQGAVVERDRNKRWSSRFVFPFGPDALYEDVNVHESSNSASREYINFGRTGELLYLMMCRSARRGDLVDGVRGIVAADNRWNRIVATLQPAAPGDRPPRGKSFLPYAEHPSFDLLTEDWIALLGLGLPGFDAYPHLAAVSSLHLVLYQLRTSAAWAEGWFPGRPAAAWPLLPLVCEIIAPRKTLVRELSLGSYARNDALSTRAVERFIAQIRSVPAWRDAASRADGFEECRALLQEWVWWGKPTDYTGPNDPDKMIEEFRTVALKRHRQHVAQFHRSLGRDIGLVSRRGTTRFRYAPTDQLLKTLLLANVSSRMELGEFLARLYERYGLVIGEREAERVLPPEDFDKKAFQSNARRLEERLGSLGLLRRLSDACAYVINPYTATASAPAAAAGAPFV